MHHGPIVWFGIAAILWFGIRDTDWVRWSVAHPHLGRALRWIREGLQ